MPPLHAGINFLEDVHIMIAKYTPSDSKSSIYDPSIRVNKVVVVVVVVVVVSIDFKLIFFTETNIIKVLVHQIELFHIYRILGPLS